MDTSAFLKLFVLETGSVEMRQQYATLQVGGKYLSGIARTESVSAVARLRKSGAASSQQASAIALAALQEIANCIEVPISFEVLKKATQLAEKHEIRTLDAIQLACAMQARRSVNQALMQFISADILLLRCAAAESFPVWNPCGPFT